ncbi:MAG: 3-deoxy-7-phosphoheptulonate synthase, partial [Bacillota bacterium]|nr:3-deoxy-7-phosphoheptulonate synthase [Bacillota bacterium]
AVAAGADGLMIEVHNQPEEALSDGAQSLKYDNFQRLMDTVHKIYAVR